GDSRTWDYEIYLPPYMSGSPPPARPTGLAMLNASFTDPDGTPVLFRPSGSPVQGFSVGTPGGGPPGPDAFDFKLTRVALVAPGSTTHHSDMHQRYIDCLVTSPGTSMVQFTAPSEAQAPRGYYMLFVLTSLGIPSEAIWVRLE
ncbi:MAG: galactose oxidase early set domain-containing protein, partial [Planctomycetota bacterium]